MERPRPKTALLILLALGLGFLLWLGMKDLLLSWELDALSFRQRLTSARPAHRPNPITLIVVDPASSTSETLKRITGEPLNRAAFAYAVRFMKRSHLRQGILDATFNAGTDFRNPENDQALIDSLAGTTRFSSTLVFLLNEPQLGFEQLSPATKTALLRQTMAVQGLNRFPALRDNIRFDGLRPPFPALLASPMHFYAANTTSHQAVIESGHADQAGATDETGESRRWMPFVQADGHLYPSLALGPVLQQTALQFSMDADTASVSTLPTLSLSPDGLLQWPGGQVHLGVDGMPLIKWYGHAAPKRIYPEIRFEDVIVSELWLECQQNPRLPTCRAIPLPARPPVLPGVLDNQYVLLGLTFPNSGDVHKTIYGAEYPGVYTQANILDNLLFDDFVRPAPGWLNTLAVLLLSGLLIGALCRFQSVWMGLLVMLTLMLGYFVLSVQAYAQANLWLNVVNPTLALGGCFSGVYIRRYLQGEKKRQQLRFAFGKYVSPGVMHTIEKNPEQIRLGGQRRDMTFLFSDIRNFTTFSENNSPEAVQTLLSQYFTVMNRIILHDYHGSINKLIGDAIMAYWGFPLDNEDHAFLAVSAAMAMREAMQAWLADPAKPRINIGIGINTGDAVVGNVGSEDFMDFTVIGDAVNVASRLEGANKEYGTNIIISASTYERVKDRIQARYLGDAKLKGKEEAVPIYEPLHFLPKS